MSTGNIGKELSELLALPQMVGKSEKQTLFTRKGLTLVTIIMMVSFVILLFLNFNSSSTTEKKNFHSPIKGFVLIKVPINPLFPYSAESQNIRVSLFTQQNELLIALAYFHPQFHLDDNLFAISLHPQDVHLILESRYYPLKAIPYVNGHEVSL